MSVEKRSRDQRKTVRCKVVDTCQGCELIVGSRVLSARLLDESAGGFAVLVGGPAGLGVDQTAELRTSAGWFAVRVIHVTEVEPPEDDGAAADEQGPWFRLGLSRLGETALPEDPTISLPAGCLRFRLGQWRPSGGTPVVLGVLLAIVAVAVPVGLINARWHAGPSRAQRLPPWKDRLTESVAPGKSRGNDSAFNDGNSAFGSNSGRAQESARSSYHFQVGQELYDTIRRLPGVTALELPEVVEKLHLTDSQQEQIRQLVETTSQAMCDLDRRMQGQQRQQISEQRTQLLDQARRKALELLSSQQRARWEKLTGTK